MVAGVVSATVVVTIGGAVGIGDDRCCISAVDWSIIADAAVVDILETAFAEDPQNTLPGIVSIVPLPKTTSVQPSAFCACAIILTSTGCPSLLLLAEYSSACFVWLDFRDATVKRLSGAIAPVTEFNCAWSSSDPVAAAIVCPLSAMVLRTLFSA
jgi:hypothetical protein